MMEAVGVALLSALCVLVGVVLAEVLREGQAPPVRATIRWTLGDVVFEGEGVSMEMFAEFRVIGNPANVTSGVALEVNVSFDAGRRRPCAPQSGAPEAPPALAVETSTTSEPGPTATEPVPVAPAVPEEAHS